MTVRLHSVYTVHCEGFYFVLKGLRFPCHVHESRCRLFESALDFCQLRQYAVCPDWSTLPSRVYFEITTKAMVLRWSLCGIKVCRGRPLSTAHRDALVSKLGFFLCRKDDLNQQSKAVISWSTGLKALGTSPVFSVEACYCALLASSERCNM